jgi:hypothetical protein
MEHHRGGKPATARPQTPRLPRKGRRFALELLAARRATPSLGLRPAEFDRVTGGGFRRGLGVAAWCDPASASRRS